MVAGTGTTAKKTCGEKSLTSQHSCPEWQQWKGPKKTPFPSPGTGLPWQPKKYYEILQSPKESLCLSLPGLEEPAPSNSLGSPERIQRAFASALKPGGNKKRALFECSLSLKWTPNHLAWYTPDLLPDPRSQWDSDNLGQVGTEKRWNEIHNFYELSRRKNQKARRSQTRRCTSLPFGQGFKQERWTFLLTPFVSMHFYPGSV